MLNNSWAEVLDFDQVNALKATSWTSEQITSDINSRKVSFLLCPEDEEELKKDEKKRFNPEVINKINENLNEMEGKPNLVFQGSSTIGRILMPKLILGFLETFKSPSQNIKTTHEDIGLPFGTQMVTGCDGKRIRIKAISGMSSTIIFDIISEESEDGWKVLRDDLKASTDSNNKSAIIAMSSTLWEEDKPQLVLEQKIAGDKIAVIINPLNPLARTPIDKGKLTTIFNGTTTRWSQVEKEKSIIFGDEKDNNINVYTRKTNSGTLKSFQHWLGINVIVNPKNTAENDLDMLSKVVKDINGIGFVSLPYAKLAKEIIINDTKAESIGINRDIILYYSTLKNEQLKLFNNLISYIKSPDGQDIVNDVGYLPIGDINHKTGSTKDVDCKSGELSEGKTIMNGIISFSPESYRINKINPNLKEGIKDIKKGAKEIWVIGFTDSKGDSISNIILSEARANEVKNHLIDELHIPTNLVKTHPCGESFNDEDDTIDETKRMVQIWYR
ncbi:MAG: hypothetical protein RIQ94_2078 [Pseudomonadota bacterium]|jgi:phosphate transport system substrate-binding protein